MKQKFLLLLTLLCIYLINAQVNPNTPWMKTLQENNSKTEFTFKEIQDSFNAYWAINDAMIYQPQ